MFAIRSRSRGSCKFCFMCRMTLIVEARYISAVWVRRPGMSCSSAFTIASGRSRVGNQRFPEGDRHRGGYQPSTVSFHAGYFLLAACHEFLAISISTRAEVFQFQADPVLHEGSQAH